MKKTIISHFYNEQYLLPWFLNHHKPIFDHGIMIDYHSTDDSVSIIKKICPTWDVITSKNLDFQADNVDYEVAEIEKNIEGWKICLNVTEHIIGDYSLMNDNLNQLLLPTIFFVDCDRENLVDPAKPLYEQKTHGFTFHRNFLERRARSLHNIQIDYPDRPTPACMGPGRHFSNYNTDKLVIFYYGWCPFDSYQIARKLQIQTQIPLVDRLQNKGFHHITNEVSLLHKLNTYFIPKSKDITEEIKYYVSTHKHLSNIL